MTTDTTPQKPLVDRLLEASQGRDEWRVQDPKDGSYCIAFNRDDWFTLDPEREARAWLADHQQRFPDSRKSTYVVACVRVQNYAERLMQEAAEELKRAARIRAAFDDIITNNSVAMQAAYIEWAGKDDAEAGMVWIGNTLIGPGLIPDIKAAKQLDANNPAQAWFDAEMAKHEAHRAAYPAPAIDPKPGYEVAADLAMMLRQCTYRLRRVGSADLADRALELLRKHGMVGTPLRQQVEADAFAAKQGTLALGTEGGAA